MLNATVGLKDKYSSNATLNLNLKKVNISAGVEWLDYTRTAINNYYRDFSQSLDTTHNAFMGQDRTSTDRNLSFRFNIAYTPNEKYSFGYSLNTGYTEFELDILAHTSGITEPASFEKYMRNTFYFKSKPKFVTNNFNYTRNLKKEGSKLSLNAYYSFIDYFLFNGQTMTEADIDYNPINDTPFLLDVLNENYSNDIRIDLDYVLPISKKTKLESGLSFHSYDRFLNISYDHFDYNSNSWVSNMDYAGKYDFLENIYGLYINFTTELAGVNIVAGLRVEYMDRLLKQQSINTSYPYDNFNFFPGLSLAKSFKNDQSIKLSLSNRINRPDEYMMNPFREFEDDYFYAEGNPFLIPELSRALELNYRNVFEKAVLSSSIYYKITTDMIAQELTIGEGNKIHTKMTNNSSDASTGVELMGNIEGLEFSRSDFSWNAQLVNSIKIKKSTSVQLIAYYRSKTIRSQGELGDFYFVDLAVKQNLFKDKLSFNFQIKDIFQSQNYHLYTETEDMQLDGYFINESPICLLSLSYKISKYKKLTKDVQTDFDM